MYKSKYNSSYYKRLISYSIFVERVFPEQPVPFMSVRIVDAEAVISME
jgi:hypothetical protein